MLKVLVLQFISINALIVLTLCHKAKWPAPGGICPTDSVINAKCSCEEISKYEKIFSCSSYSNSSSDGDRKSGKL